MGPRAAARGNKHRANLQAGAEPASMGPRAAARGNGKGEPEQFQIGDASMGPRAAARGNIPSPCRTQSALRLQWGREQLLAEMRVVVEFVDAAQVLQWGREQLLAEIHS